MRKKTYILQAGFQPVGQTDVTGWRTFSFYTGPGAYDRAVAEYRKEVDTNQHPQRRFRIASAYDTTRKDTYTPVFGFKSAACTF